MPPQQNNPKIAPAAKIPSDDAKGDAYAEALAKIAALDYQMEQKTKPEQKHIISKKVLIYIAFSIILSIIGGIIFDAVIKDKSPSSNSEDTPRQLLDTTKEVRNLEN